MRNVLVHLYEWHNLLIVWEKSNVNGTATPFLPFPYNWKTYGEMNVVFWQKNQNTPLSEAKKILKDSHIKVVAVIEKYDNEQLFTKAFYKWIGSSSLGQYCVSATASYYDWAIKKLKAQIKSCKS